MTKMVLGVFSNKDQAEDVIIRLEDADYNSKDISIVMKDSSEAVSGAATGGVIGGIAGLLVGIGAITIPGIGAILIGGPLAAALGLTGAAATTVSGALTGALAGGLVGVLVSLGVPADDARIYEDRIKKGAILVTVPAREGQQREVELILEESGADQIRSVGYDKTEEEEYGRAAYFSDVRRGNRTSQ